MQVQLNRPQRLSKFVCLFSGLLGCQRFSSPSQNYSTLLLEEDNGVLYVGARGALYALDTTNISTPGILTVSAGMLTC